MNDMTLRRDQTVRFDNFHSLMQDPHCDDTSYSNESRKTTPLEVIITSIPQGATDNNDIVFLEASPHTKTNVIYHITLRGGPYVMLSFLIILSFLRKSMSSSLRK